MRRLRGCLRARRRRLAHQGHPVGASAERARLMHLYSAWGFAVLFGGSIIANTLEKLFRLLV